MKRAGKYGNTSERERKVDDRGEKKRGRRFSPDTDQTSVSDQGH
jgi:hypothetical protein